MNLFEDFFNIEFLSRKSFSSNDFIDKNSIFTNFNSIFFEDSYLNESLLYGLGYSWENNFTTILFSGAIYNSYQLNIYVQVYDNDQAFTTYEIEQSITVVPDKTNFQTLKSKLILADPLFETNVILNEGAYLSSIQELQSISSLLNDESLSDKVGLMQKDNSTQFPEMYGALSNYMGILPVFF